MRRHENKAIQEHSWVFMNLIDHRRERYGFEHFHVKLRRCMKNAAWECFQPLSWGSSLSGITHPESSTTLYGQRVTKSHWCSI